MLVILALGYLVLVLGVTLLPIFGVHPDEPITVQLTPLESLRNGFAERPMPTLLFLIGNIAMFIPFGVLIPALRRHASALLVAATALLLSTAIEVTQLGMSLLLGYRYRVAEVDDVILNVAGALVGYVGFRVWVSARRVEGNGSKRTVR